MRELLVALLLSRVIVLLHSAVDAPLGHRVSQRRNPRTLAGVYNVLIQAAKTASMAVASLARS
jgi:hypothetical protein